MKRPRRGRLPPSASEMLARWLVAATLLSGCASSNTLHEYDYRGRGLTVISDLPSAPNVLSGPYFVGHPSGDPVRDMVRIGARVAREVEAVAIRERLDSASTLIDVGSVLEVETVDRVARYLGARVERDGSAADFLLELVVLDYGIDAETWDAAAHVYIEADAALLHVESGAEIWRAEIGARDPLGPAIFGPTQALRDVVTAATLASLDVEELVSALEYLADYSARVITDRLRDDLREARGR
ncbi:MAG: hypothetical protein OEN56_02715 [Gemmatimonadota bacterium]|nr:hypothetical protein [Gemmatimonadota bacterium]